jgi:carbon-monoxide dehydrogenase small subunit
MKLELTVNGQAHEVDVEPMRSLLDVLREELRLTGSKEGCAEGECGACTVLIDGAPVCSCLVAVAQAEGHDLRTIEGLADGPLLSDVQSALVEHGGTQCGICTPGIALCATAALDAEPDADRARLRELIAGNLCRCTGYQLIIDALCAAQAARRSEG